MRLVLDLTSVKFQFHGIHTAVSEVGALGVVAECIMVSQQVVSCGCSCGEQAAVVCAGANSHGAGTVVLCVLLCCQYGPEIPQM